VTTRVRLIPPGPRSGRTHRNPRLGSYESPQLARLGRLLREGAVAIPPRIPSHLPTPQQHHRSGAPGQTRRPPPCRALFSIKIKPPCWPSTTVTTQSPHSVDAHAARAIDDHQTPLLAGSRQVPAGVPSKRCFRRLPVNQEGRRRVRQNRKGRSASNEWPPSATRYWTRIWGLLRMIRPAFEHDRVYPLRTTAGHPLDALDSTSRSWIAAPRQATCRKLTKRTLRTTSSGLRCRRSCSPSGVGARNGDGHGRTPRRSHCLDDQKSQRMPRTVRPVRRRISPLWYRIARIAR